MSTALIVRSPDLQRLQDEGYRIEIVHGHLLVHDLPYVAAGPVALRGTLVSTLNLAGDKTTTPDTHVIFFAGDEPCDAAGQRLASIINDTAPRDLAPGIAINFTFSSKPSNGYPDYYEKVTSYVRILEGPAQAIDPEMTARTGPRDAA